MITRRAMIGAAAWLPALRLATPIATTSRISTAVTPDFPVGLRLAVGIPLGGRAIDSVELLYSIPVNDTVHVELIPSTDVRLTTDIAEIDTVLDLQARSIPSGLAIQFRWRLKSDGDPIVTPSESTAWIDDRWTWTHDRTAEFELHTYGIGKAFHDEMLSTTTSTVQSLAELYAVMPPTPIQIWLYPDAEAFSGTRMANAREAVAGISYPDYHLIAAVIPDGDSREFGRVVPHELSHQMLALATENPIAKVPLWFDEGMATHSQTSGTDGFPNMVVEAWKQDALFDLMSLSDAFPFQPSHATLAYAASWSAVQFMRERWGDDSITRYVRAFRDEHSQSDPLGAAFDLPIAQFNDAWREWIPTAF